MKNIVYNFLDYNDKNNILYSTIEKISKDKESLIVIENGMAENYYFAYLNKSILDARDNLISFENFWENIFINDRKNLKDIKRFFLFYSCLNEDMKKKLNVNSYFECIEVADDFFEFFRYIKSENELEKISLSKWQEEKFNIFFEIKKDFDKLLNENNYIPADWIDDVKNLNSDFIKKYKKIIFYDIVEFPENFSFIAEELKKYSEIEIVLQMSENDFNKEKYKLNKITLPERKIKLNLKSYSNDLELYTLVEENKNKNYFSTDTNAEDKYSIFSKSNKYYLNDTKFYQIIESYLNILNAIDYKNNGLIDIFVVKENIFKAAFMEFYGLDNQDYNTFVDIISADYRYISLKIMEENKFDYYLKENTNLSLNLKKILKNLSEIEKIKNIENLNEFLRSNFFNSDENIKFFVENKFDTIYDKIYEILGLLNYNENMEFFQNFSSIFNKQVGKNIFTLFFNYLNKITIYSSQKNKAEKSLLKDFFSIKYSKQNLESVVLVHTDSQSLPKVRVNNNLFTEKQKKELGLLTNEEEILIQKYRFFQNIFTLSELEVSSLVDVDNNIDYSAFIYELKNKYEFEENKESNLKEFVKALYEQNKTENFYKEEPKFRAFLKEKSDFENSKLIIGAYDYIDLASNETFFFLDKICGLDSKDESEAVAGISSSLLGKIVHKTMEEIFRDKWKEILKSSENLLISFKEIRDYLKKNMEKEKLKRENFMEEYIENIFIPRFSINIEKFFKILYEELKDKKITRIEAEKGEKKQEKEIPYFVYERIEVYLNGRADLIIETENQRYIIDFKTGNANSKQLEFYAVMFYGKDNDIADMNENLSVYSASYNLWNDKETDKFNFSKALFLKNEIKEGNKILARGLKETNIKIKEILQKFLAANKYKLPTKSSLVENKYNFKEYYRYANLIPLDKMIGDEDDK